MGSSKHALAVALAGLSLAGMAPISPAAETDRLATPARLATAPVACSGSSMVDGVAVVLQVVCSAPQFIVIGSGTARAGVLGVDPGWSGEERFVRWGGIRFRATHLDRLDQPIAVVVSF